MHVVSINNRPRISSIDVLRGIIMIIMAIDHTRDYFHIKSVVENPVNLETTTPALFFTRWITHYCAPVFLFLSGISAFISGQKKTKSELSLFLLKRGIWFILLDAVLMSFIFSFNPQYNIIFLAVLWAFGCSMIVLAILVQFGAKAVLAAGIILVAGHNLLDYLPAVKAGEDSLLMKFLLTGRGFPVILNKDHIILVTYAILPWTAIMLLGYSFGSLYKKDFDPVKRRKFLLVSGIGITALFLLLRVINIYGDPNPWAQQKSSMFTFISFLNATKYPISLQFTCMTIGPALIFLSFTENVKTKLNDFVSVYGKTPLFYFIGHFLLIHILCTIVFFATGHTMSEASDGVSPFLFRPAKFGFGLKTMYLVWLVVILLMYYPCKWYGKYKETHTSWWLSYL